MIGFIKSSFAFLLSLCLLNANCNCSPLTDRVTSLPGWEGDLTSAVYSGFIPAGNETQNGINYSYNYWYVFIEAEAPLDPLKAPIIIWSNGGPGASSAYGLFTEFGPYQLSDQSLKTQSFQTTGVPTLFRNTFAWTRLANVLIVNGGGPTGFSYCDPIGPSGNGSRCGDWNDDSTALHNSLFVINWLKAFNQYQNNQLFLIGESYAGVYMPMLFEKLLSASLDDSLNSNSNKLNLVGLALGDACVGTDILCGAKTGPWYSLLFKGGHGCISVTTFESILDDCPRDKLKSGDLSNLSPACSSALASADKECPSGSFYEYNYYDKCSVAAFQTSASLDNLITSPIEPNGFPCGGDNALTQWISNPLVKKSLNVPADAVYFSQDNGAGFTYTSTYKSALPFLKQLALDGTHRVLVYNGDSDPGISTFRAQSWINSNTFGLGQSEAWRPFTLNDDPNSRVAGTVTQYTGNFSYVQIKGSGHMVPLYAPAEAFTVVSSFLNNNNLPSFNPTPTI